ncbi:hypothetical protein [Streptomyces sp. URMC 123]|uniref:hypothetical protein n=1 Tax=Streptomyces sp. URMC 123 TaxID=3423403 RepID=UPI003F1ADACA
MNEPMTGPGGGPEGAPEQGGPATGGPLGVERAATGRPEVDEVLRRLADADHLAVEEHLAVYEDVHGGLREALAALDARPGPPPPAGPPGHGGRPAAAPE